MNTLSQYNEPSSAPTNWPDRQRLALSIVVNVEEGAEQSVRDGDPRPEPIDELGVVLRKLQRNLANESNYRYGIQAGAPRILALLAKKNVTATFTCAALSLELPLISQNKSSLVAMKSARMAYAGPTNTE